MAHNDLELKGFDELERTINPRSFEGRMMRNIKKATLLNAQVARKYITQSITSGNYTDNSPVTAAIKGSNRPLVDKGMLLQSITGEAESWDTAIVGVLRSRMTTDANGRPKDVMSLAKILHEGATIKVTPKMRKYLAMMSRLHPGKYFPLKQSTDTIVIPPRRFLESALEEQHIQKYQDNWQDAVTKTLNGRR